MSRNWYARASSRRFLALAPVLLMLGFTAWTAILFRRTRDARAWVQHTENVILNSMSALSHVQDAEAGERGYLISGSQDYLATYAMGRDSSRIELARLRRLTSDNPRQQSLLTVLEPIVEQRLMRLDSALTGQRRGDTSVALEIVRSPRGRQLMDSARIIFDELRTEERRLLALRERRQEDDERTTSIVLLVGVLLSALVSFLVSGSFGRAAKRQADISRELLQRNDKLQQQAVAIDIANQQLQEQQVELEASADLMREHTLELERTTDALRQANAAKGMFLANISHELRTPLNAIAGHVQLVEMELHGPVTLGQRGALERVSRAQRHLLALINDILNFSKLEAGRVAFDIEEVDVIALMQDVSAMVESQMTTAGLSFTQHCDATACIVLADEEKLRQILINLFGNATKFTPFGGSVRLDVRPLDGDDTIMLLSVSDTGIGIPEDKLDQIFDPFVQLGAPTAGPLTGAGLGLAISRDLARGMNGELTVSSRVGEGSRFTLALRRATRQS
ncbi:MAG: CHASE3 domain-containing protein [Gemmatimonadota bacterium]